MPTFKEFVSHPRRETFWAMASPEDRAARESLPRRLAQVQGAGEELRRWWSDRFEIAANEKGHGPDELKNLWAEHKEAGQKATEKYEQEKQAFREQYGKLWDSMKDRFGPIANTVADELEAQWREFRSIRFHVGETLRTGPAYPSQDHARALLALRRGQPEPSTPSPEAHAAIQRQVATAARATSPSGTSPRPSTESARSATGGPTPPPHLARQQTPERRPKSAGRS